MEPKLDWSEFENAGLGDAYADIPKTGGNFAKAVAVCINSLVCLRPVDKGVMCPSFRVHQDAAFSPGGRSRLLKKLLNGEITDEEKLQLDKAMLACIGCKGCKRECETGLDIAAIRTEYIAANPSVMQHKKRDRLFARLPELMRFPLLLRLLISIRNNSSFVAGYMERKFGISAAVKLPQLSSEQPDIPAAGSVSILGSNSIALMVDSFSRYYSPRAVTAAYELLKRAGYDVRIIGGEGRPAIEGRTWFSAGDVEGARKKSNALIEELTPFIKANTPVIGLEPSSILMLRDEYKLLNPGQSAEQLSTQALMFEEFVAREITAGRFRLPFKNLTRDKVLVHGHCHQKSVGAMKSVRKVLKLIPDLEFEFIDSSCCGGGGSFAYEAEHQQESEQMFNMNLKGALEAQPEAVVIANGFSCKSQIGQYAGRHTVHLAEFLNAHI